MEFILVILFWIILFGLFGAFPSTQKKDSHHTKDTRSSRLSSLSDFEKELSKERADESTSQESDLESELSEVYTNRKQRPLRPQANSQTPLKDKSYEHNSGIQITRSKDVGD